MRQKRLKPSKIASASMKATVPASPSAATTGRASSSLIPFASSTNCSAKRRAARSRSEKPGSFHHASSRAIFASSRPAARASGVRIESGCGRAVQLRDAQAAQLEQHGIDEPLPPEEAGELAPRREQIRPQRERALEVVARRAALGKPAHRAQHLQLLPTLAPLAARTAGRRRLRLAGR